MPSCGTLDPGTVCGTVCVLSVATGYRFRAARHNSGYLQVLKRYRTATGTVMDEGPLRFIGCPLDMIIPCCLTLLVVCVRGAEGSGA